MTSWKKRLIGAAVTGVLAEIPASAANIVVNPSFESVTGTEADSWSGNVSTYAYAQNFTQAGPPGSGLRYWFGAGSLSAPQATQLITSLGIGNSVIDAGNARYDLSAFFSTYLSQNDYGSVQVIFLDSLNATLGSSSAIGGLTFTQGLDGGSGLRAWGQDTTTGTLPVGTRSIRVEVTGTRLQGGVSDGYVDLVDLQLTELNGTTGGAGTTGGTTGSAEVPEPGTLAATGAGIVLLTLVSRRKQK